MKSASMFKIRKNPLQNFGNPASTVRIMKKWMEIQTAGQLIEKEIHQCLSNLVSTRVSQVQFKNLGTDLQNWELNLEFPVLSSTKW